MPGAYMKLPAAERARHCLESIAPDFAASVQRGDVVVGGANFGMGSSREQAAEALLTLGVGAVLARSFARIFQRNCLNLGLPALVCEDAGEIAQSSQLEVDVAEGWVQVHGGARWPCRPLPDFLVRMVQSGGLIPHLQQAQRARNVAQENA
ncbi:MAG: 3-isopropylmalate dehydratase [Deltaproteobacteria bacterium]|nr:3-isopropylmalate dehydratase [Deltaproteobacteria bacterium]